MPFTPAHPAIVLPFINKKYFSATALIIGSISPDFEYFFKASVSGVHGHSVAGILYFDLPVAIFVSLVFHLLIKKNLFANLPAFLQRRFHPTMSLDFKKILAKQYVVVIYSALMGAATHVFWDSFTHNGAFFVRNLELYKQVRVPFQGVNYPLFYALQHISTITGLTVIAFYIFFMPASLSVKPFRPRIQYWLLLVFTGSVFFALRFFFLPNDFNLGNAIVTGISALILSLCILGSIKIFRPLSTQNVQP